MKHILIPIAQADNSNLLNLQKLTFPPYTYTTHAKVNEDESVSEYAIQVKPEFTEDEINESASLDGLYFESAALFDAWKFQYGYTEWNEELETYIVHLKN